MDTCSDLHCECNCHRQKDARCTTAECGAFLTNGPKFTPEDVAKLRAWAGR